MQEPRRLEPLLHPSCQGHVFGVVHGEALGLRYPLIFETSSDFKRSTKQSF